MKSTTLCLALFLCGFVECRTCTAEAQSARVDAEQLCAVKRALKCGTWSPRTCERIAAALNETRDPVLFAAIAVNESMLNERAINVVRPGVYDLGLAQVRCVTLGAVAESIGDSSANSEATTTPTIPRDRCTNGAARGLYAHRLLDPGINTHTAERVFYETHKGSFIGYSGSTRERGYGARIAALVDAFHGELRIPKGATGKKWARVRELARRIVQAINERKTVMTKKEAREFKQTHRSHKEQIAKVLANASAGCDTNFPKEWTKEARREFRRMAQAMLDFFAPVIDELN